MCDREVGLREGRGWRYSEPTQWPKSAPQAVVVVIHLLSMLATGLRMAISRVNTFSGNATPGKTEVSFEQWYHEVQCVKDHFPEAVVWESIIQSVKRALVDMARYKRPTASIAHILCKLLVICGMVALMMFLCRTSVRSAR